MGRECALTNLNEFVDKHREQGNQAVTDEGIDDTSLRGMGYDLGYRRVPQFCNFWHI